MAKACSLPGRLFAFEHRVQKLSIQPIHRMIRYHSSSEFQFFAFKLNPISSEVKKMAKACSLPGRLFAFEHRVQKLSIQPTYISIG